MQFVLLNVQMFLVSMRTEDGACSVYENAARNSILDVWSSCLINPLKIIKIINGKKIERKKSKKCRF